MITVIIPTASRPQFLRTALGSVLRESILESIGQVLFAGNSAHWQFKKICVEFADLPLERVDKCCQLFCYTGQTL